MSLLDTLIANPLLVELKEEFPGRRFNDLFGSKSNFFSVTLAQSKAANKLSIYFCDLAWNHRSKMNYNVFMSTIPLREDILDDVTYLQKHLRLIIKFHQVSGKPLWRCDPTRDTWSW